MCVGTSEFFGQPHNKQAIYASLSLVMGFSLAVIMYAPAVYIWWA